MSPESLSLPATQQIALDRRDGVLHITFDRAAVSNALDTATVDELAAVFAAIRNAYGLRAVVLRGAGRHFCAGADLKSVGQGEGADRRAAVIAFNRRFGGLLAAVNAAPQVVVAKIQGAALGGGFGLACVADIAIATRGATMGMPETRLGLPAAQILPFVVARIGAAQARYIALRGARFDGAEAERIGVVHDLAEDEETAEALLEERLAEVLACAPGANALSKRVVNDCGLQTSSALMASGAERFADCLLGAEGQEGIQAFAEKRLPAWVPQ